MSPQKSGDADYQGPRNGIYLKFRIADACFGKKNTWMKENFISICEDETGNYMSYA